MNNSKIWLVVKPTVGVPLFLGAVAVGSFAVHVAVLSNTGWVSDFLSGNELGASQQAALEAPAVPAGAQFSRADVYLDEGASGPNQQRTVVVLPDGRTAYATFDTTPLTVAAR